MSIETTLTALQGDITAARAAIVEKGGVVTSGGGSRRLAEDIATIPSGGGEVPHAGVVFIDYDGSVVAVWSSTSVAGKTSLPTNPTHTGLIAQGWNWTLADIKQHILDYPDATINVGQMYATSSGLTEIDITLTKVNSLSVTCNMPGRKTWGDGTTNSATTHTYSAYGKYTITCNGTSIPAGTSSAGGMFGSAESNLNGYWCTSIRIGTNVTSIGDYAFYYCSSLTSITIPSGVTSIGNNTFESCYALKCITIPNRVTSIGNRAFYGCYSLASIILSRGVTSIGNYAFHHCHALTSITLPSGVTSIGDYAFYYCSSLASITIPSGVTSIGGYTFYYCTSLTSITVTNRVTSIGAYAFGYCHALKSVTMPNGVTSIGSNAFYYCYALTSITIPNRVTSIGTYAFSYCYALTSITIPNGVTSIGHHAFYRCYSAIKYDFSSASEVPTLDNGNAFDSISGICKIVVPDALYSSWTVATNWGAYSNYVYKASEAN